MSKVETRVEMTNDQQSCSATNTRAMKTFVHTTSTANSLILLE